jgi:hypothetical protein
MPFTIEPIETTHTDTEGQFTIRGRVREGAYFGPEQVLVRTVEGAEYRSHIHSHGMEHPEGWPVLPGHRKTVLVLHLPAAPAKGKIVSVIGLGAVTLSAKRTDVSDALTQREFWAMQLHLHFVSDQVDDPSKEWLDVPSKKADRWYKTRIDSHIAQGIWPYVRVPLPSSRYIELEMAGGVEYQDRIWIGDQSGNRKVLLGYHSGHFSLPALRADEVRWLAEVTHSDASNLLWLAAAYMEEGTNLLPLATRLASQVPGLRPGKASAMAEALHRNREVTNLEWVRDPSLGWINNWSYSQRNPQSQLSILGKEDFAYIESFFS